MVPISGIHTQKLSKNFETSEDASHRVEGKKGRTRLVLLLLLLLLLQHCRPFVSLGYRTRISRNNARASSNTEEKIALSEKKWTGYRVNERMRTRYRNR